MTTVAKTKARASKIADEPVLPKPPSVDAELRHVTFHGREIKVKQPTAEQLYAWERTLIKIQGAVNAGVDADTERLLFNRCLIIINAVIADEIDREWLEDRQLDGTVTVQDASEIVIGALNVYAEEMKAQPANQAARLAKA